MRTCYWPRAIIHVDTNAFFASLEGRHFPILHAPAMGGVGALEFTTVSSALMQAVTHMRPEVEILSKDEVFIDVTHCQGLHGSPEHIADIIKQRMHTMTRGLPCSVGVAGDKSIAKIASDLCKPNGLTVIPPWQARERLRPIPLENIRVIAPRISAFLRLYGAGTCGDVAAMPVDILIRRYGMLGKQVWLMCQGRDTLPLVQEMAPPKFVSQGKVLPPRTLSRRTLLTYVRHLCEKLAARLRRCDVEASNLCVELRYAHGGAADGIVETLALPYAAPDGKGYFGRTQALLEQQWQGQAVTHMWITATHLRNASGQLELFSPDEVLAMQC